MGNFFDNVWSAISLLAWSDWVTLIILIVFVVRGFVQGLAKGSHQLYFCYFCHCHSLALLRNLCENFSEHPGLAADNQSIYALSFGGIFLSIWLVKKGLYRIASASSSNQNPNELNRPFANVVITLSLAVISFNYLGVFSDLNTFDSLISNESLRNFVSFIALFALLSCLPFYALSKLLNIRD